jgi:hypothetical protein
MIMSRARSVFLFILYCGQALARSSVVLNRLNFRWRATDVRDTDCFDDGRQLFAAPCRLIIVKEDCGGGRSAKTGVGFAQINPL